MAKKFLFMMVFGAGMAFLKGGFSQPLPPALQAGTASAQPVRPVGIVTQIQPGSLSLHTDSGAELTIQLPDAVTVVRVPPGSKDLKAATKINLSDINTGDRVLVRGKLSDDQKSVAATSVIVMSKTDLATAQEAERLEWQQRGIRGVVKAVNPGTKEMTISVPNTPPTPGNPTHPVTLTLSPTARLLRYAPDSVKFSDAKAGTFEEIQVGDQVRALGSKNEDGSRFTAEKLVSGTFRNLAATVISVDAGSSAVTVKDLASGRPIVVKTNSDSKMHRLPPMLAQMIAMFNSGQMPGGGAGGGSGARPQGGNTASGTNNSTRPTQPASGTPASGWQGGRGQGDGSGGGMGGAPRDFNQMLDRTPPLALGELKPGDALIVLSTAGIKPSEVTAIVMLAGVEPILSARPKGNNDVVLGPWNMSTGGGDTGP